ncbi:MAG: 16S rRNA (cytosine(1402)-N(4))-methyltransferase RsmH [Patescibacteria group bacterium]
MNNTIQKNPRHVPVLLKEITDLCMDSKLHLDCNFGDGGHVEQLLVQNPTVHIHAIDADEQAIARAEYFLQQNTQITDVKKRLTIHKGNFGEIEKLLGHEMEGKFDTVLFDLGLSTYQLGESNRGFSFKYDEPLDMRFSTDVLPEDTGILTAYDIVNTWSPENIALILRTYAEEQSAWKIAKAIEARREQKPIQTSKELADLISEVVKKKGGIHPATKTFQAIRITVNGELQVLESGLNQAQKMLAPNGKMIVISYHSLEDRIVKNIFKNYEEEGKGERMNKKVIVPTDAEIEANPRSRSAKLRIYTQQ